MKRSSNLLLTLIIAAVGIAGGVIFVKTRPEAERKRPPRMTPVVESQPLEAGSQKVLLNVMGTVLPARQVLLKAQVTGKIVATSSGWIEGGRFAEGAQVMSLEPSDYDIALQQAQADLEQAQSEQALESGRQDVAKHEWELLGNKGSERDRELALRTPQRQAAAARVAFAQARVRAAKLALSRTAITAPFNALVVERNMNQGDLATPQASLGTLVDSDEFYVRASVPVDKLKWITFPDSEARGSMARVILPDGGEREGQVIRLLPDLEPTGRMARVLVSVPNPVKGTSPLLLASYVKVQIEGKTIDNACRISREHYREGGQVWLVTPEKTLRIVKAQPLWSNRDSVIVQLPGRDDESLITSALAAAVDGMDLRVAGQDGPPTDGREEPEGRAKQDRREQKNRE